jgi:predicted N-acyltransferase
MLPPMSEAHTVRVLSSLAEIEPAQWDACAGAENPFVSHAFLAALEDSGSATRKSGWQPQHLVLEGKGGVAGVMPLYLKSHSYGEYVFDHGWAQAWERAGGHYYPKLQSCVPFSPVPGPRLLVPPGPDAAARKQVLVAGAVELARRLDVSSLHVTFPDEADWTLLGESGLLQRTGEQFHWANNNYRDFDDYLEALASRKRKAVRKERRDAVAAGIEIVALSGSDLRDEHWDAFYEFYMDTGSRKWGSPYLNRKFFTLLNERMADKVVLILARRAGRWIAGALNLRGSDTLYGRNWGCTEHHPFLHFEVCYYQAIDYAIRHGLKRVEAGAQGEHKLARGYLPTPTYSAHWIADAGFRRAVADFLKKERQQVAAEIEYYAGHSPFRHTEDAG